MSGICSKHRHHEPGCQLCEALYGSVDPFPNAPGLWEVLKKGDAPKRPEEKAR